MESSPLMYAMNLNFNDDQLYIICIYRDKSSPKFCSPWGATSECGQIYIRKKDMQYDMLYSQANKRK